jgi:hypothetical protein
MNELRKRVLAVFCLVFLGLAGAAHSTYDFEILPDLFWLEFRSYNCSAQPNELMIYP